LELFFKKPSNLQADLGLPYKSKEVTIEGLYFFEFKFTSSLIFFS